MQGSYFSICPSKNKCKAVSLERRDLRKYLLLIHISHRNPNLKLTAFELPFNLSEVSEVTQFVARHNELDKMQEIFEITVGHCTVGRRTAILHGLGGIGKTQLAIAYVKRYRTKYSAVIWLNSKNETMLKQSFHNAAEWILRHHPFATYVESALQSRDLERVVKAVIRWLDEPLNIRWMIIYDNFDNPSLNKHKGSKLTSCAEASINSAKEEDLSSAFDLQKFLPETDHGSIIVTTRLSTVKLGKTVQLGKLEDINDGLAILESVSGRVGLDQGEFP